MFRLALALCLATAMYAQSRFETYNTENGLPGNTVLALRQTKDGYLWFTTYQGLVRFDGVRFQVFDPSNTPVLRSTIFATGSLFEDREGALWAGTWSSGAIRYKNGTFTSYTAKEGLPSNTVVRVDEDRDGTIWFFNNPGLSRLRNGRIEAVKEIDGEAVAPYLMPPRQLGVDPYLSGLWRFRENRLERFAFGHWSAVPLPAGLIDASSVRLTSLMEDGQGRLWFGVAGRPGRIYCVKGQQIREWQGPATTSFGSYLDRFDRLWMSDDRGRTGWWQNGRFHLIQQVSTLSPYRVLEDREGGFWIGTLEGGLAHGLTNVVEMRTLPGGRAANVLQPIAQDRAGQIWVANNGLTELAGDTQRTFFRPHSGGGVNDIPSAIYPDADGSLLCGYRDGVAVLRNGRFEKPEPALQTIHNEINAILRDRNGDLWLGGEVGLYRYSHCKLDLFGPQGAGLLGDVRSLYLDRDGSLWIGTDAAIYRYKGGSKIERVAPQDELAQWGVRFLTSDADGVIWAGTARQGIVRVERDGVVAIGSKDGLSSNDAGAILEDGNGYFWVGSRLGIYRVKREDLNEFAQHRSQRVHSTLFRTADGLNALESVGKGQPRGFRDKDGVLWFPTTDGLARINPQNVSFNNEPPPVVIEGCTLEQKSMACQAPVTLPAGANDFEVRYTALSLMRSRQIAFRYRLAGLETRWTEAGNRRTAYFSHLPPGEYRFSVIAANSDGIWNQQGAQLAVTVLPHFYQTLWFQALIGGMVISLFATAWRMRRARFDRQQALQQAFAQQVITSQEIERKRIASELHDSLGQHLSVIKNTALLLAEKTANGHLNGAGFIVDEASRAIGEMRKISYNLRPYQLDLLGLTRAIEELARRTGEGAHLEMDVVVDDLSDVFAREKEIHFYRIVQECLNNVVKHAGASRVRILVQQSGPMVTLVIQDNGVGFAPGKTEEDASKGGFGLLGIKERVHLLGGVLKIHSVPGGGTTVSIEFQVEAAATSR